MSSTERIESVSESDRGKYRVTKTYGHDKGVSCAFRQWRAESHCKFIHGYSLSFAITFEAEEGDLTDEGWVIDFGDLNWLEDKLRFWFDHTTILASDDPLLDFFKAQNSRSLRLRELNKVGCEAFARHVYLLVFIKYYSKRQNVVKVTCSEHSGNSATYIGGKRKREGANS